MKELTEEQVAGIYELSKTMVSTIDKGCQMVLFNDKAHRKIVKNNETGLYDVTLNGEYADSHNYQGITSYIYGLLLSEAVVNGDVHG